MKKLFLSTAIALIGTMSAMAQWGSQASESVVIYDESFGEIESKMAPNGSTWVYYQAPTDTEYTGIGIYVQLIDSTGNKLFGEEGLLVSNHPNRTWTLCNHYLFVDKDGNALITVHDIRNAVETKYLSYHIYKISPTGEFLWGEDGLELEPGKSFALSSHMSMTQIADGSYVMTWSCNNEETGQPGVKFQRITADGEALWDIEEVQLYDPDGKVQYTWPTVVDANNNQVIVVYFKGSNMDMYVRKIDFDGTSAWDEDTRIYRSGWSNIPPWSLIDVQPSGDGGVIVAWSDDRYLNGTSTYMNYVKSNGEIGFSAGVDGQKLGYSDYVGSSVKCLYDPHSDSFIAMWDEAISESFFRIKAQSLNKDGELLWSEEGYTIQPFSQDPYAYFSLQNAPDNEVAFFYMHNRRLTNADGIITGTNTDMITTLVNTTDTTQRRDLVFTNTDDNNPHPRADLFSSGNGEHNFWTVIWNNDYVANPTLHIQRINNDLTLGNPDNSAVNSISIDNNTFVATSTIVEGEAKFAVNIPASTRATLTIHNMNGALVATPFNGVLNSGTQYINWVANAPAGVYLATLTTEQGSHTIKLLVK